MILFFIKKAFFDGWDNLLSLILPNLIFITLICVGILLPGLLNPPLEILLSCAVLTGALLSVWWATCIRLFKETAEYRGFSLADIIPALAGSWIPGLHYYGMMLVLFLGALFGIPFYFAQEGFGLVAGTLLFWGVLVAVLSIQYYLPLRVRMGGGFTKNLHKSFLVFFDNPLFSLFLLAYSILGLVISFATSLLLPGLSGVALGYDVALKLRLYKYDWLEANPGAKRSAPPWAELLAEDRELLGMRTLKGMFFPWKE